MKVLVVTCLFLVAVVELSWGQFCGPNEQEVECVNPCNTCDDRTVCIQSCIPGCDCLPGHLRNRNGFCVPVRFCGRRFGSPEVGEDESEGCPDNRKCHRSCAKKGYNGGSCGGHHKQHCKCY